MANCTTPSTSDPTFSEIVKDVDTIERTLEFFSLLEAEGLSIEDVLDRYGSVEDSLESLQADFAALQRLAAGSPVVVPTEPIQLGLITHLLPEKFETGGAWYDATDSNNHFSIEGIPTLVPNWKNGKPAIALDGSDDAFIRNGMPDLFGGATSRHSIFMVFESDNSVSGQGLIYAEDEAGTMYHNVRIAGSIEQLSLSRHNGAVALTSLVASGGASFQDPTIFVETQKTSTSFDTQVIGELGEITGQLSVANELVNWRIGSGLTEFFQGKIGEVLVYDRQLSALETTIVVGYLSEKFAITIPA